MLRESADRHLVRFLELSTGAVAGTCRLVGEGDAQGLAISRDGQLLASVVNEEDGIKVIQVDLAAPKRVPDFKASAIDLFSDDGYQGSQVEWLPDGKHLLVAGRLVVDTARSEVARTLPPPPPSPLVSAGPGVTLAFNGRELSELPLNLQIDSAAVPAVKPSESLPAAPLNGPPVVAGDKSKSVQKSISAAGRWDVRLAAPPNVSDKLDTNGFRIPGGFVHQVLFAGRRSRFRHGRLGRDIRSPDRQFQKPRRLFVSNRGRLGEPWRESRGDSFAGWCRPGRHLVAGG
jgi:hypothetical protein